MQAFQDHREVGLFEIQTRHPFRLESEGRVMQSRPSHPLVSDAIFAVHERQLNPADGYPRTGYCRQQTHHSMNGSKEQNPILLAIACPIEYLARSVEQNVQIEAQAFTQLQVDCIYSIHFEASQSTPAVGWKTPRLLLHALNISLTVDSGKYGVSPALQLINAATQC